MPALGTVLSTTSIVTTAEFDDHSVRHENGGADEISVAGLSGTLADPQTAAAHAASHQDGGADEISIAGLAGTPLDLTAHLTDTADAHDASAVSVVPFATIAATDVQAALEEIVAEVAGGGAPTTADYLVGTAQAGLSAEIVVGATPGGELGGTWASPTVDATHSGSAHHDAVTVGTGLDVTGQLVELDLSEVAAGGELAGFMDAPTVDASHSGSTHAAAQAAAEATAAGALSAHAGAVDPHTGYRLESADHSHASTGAQGGTLAASAIVFTPNGSIAATNVQTAIQEVRDEATGGGVTNPMSADLDAGGFGIIGADDGSNIGARLTVGAAAATFGGSVILNGGDDATGNVGAQISAYGAEDGAGGGGFDLFAGTGLGTPDNPGGTVNLQAGPANTAEGAKIRLEGGADDGTTHGRIRITTNFDTGDAGYVLTAQGDDTALWAAASGGAPTWISIARWGL